LGKFNEDSYKFSGENYKLKVVKGALVVAKGELFVSLYRLIGDTSEEEERERVHCIFP
jgi:hypothetical protein